MGSVADLGRDFCHSCEAWHEPETCRQYRTRVRRETKERDARAQKCKARMAEALDAARHDRPVEPVLARWARAHAELDRREAEMKAALKPLAEERKAAWHELEFSTDADFARFIPEDRGRW